MSSIQITDLCLPCEWMDEVNPQCGSSPAEFLCLRDGIIWLVSREDREAFLAGTLKEDDAVAAPRALKVGEEVEFSFARDDFPDVSFKRLDDGAIHFLDEIPEGANLFGCGSDMIIEDDPVTAAKAMLADDPANDFISCWYWSQPVVYIVNMDATCVPHFERKGTLQ